MADVQLDGVSKVFPGGAHALDGVSLSAADGVLLVFVGPSGCGKTTTLRLVAGLEEPTAGTIRIGGREVAGVAPQDRDVAAVFQGPALYPHLTVAGNLGFGLRVRRVPRAEVDRVIHLMADRLGIADLLDRRPHELSGGQRQRVAIGRALVRRPACLLLDEPLSHLDAPLRHALGTDIRRLPRETGTTTLYVTHDPDEAMAVADRVAVLVAGQVRQVGTPRDVYDRPASRFVFAFFGSTPANTIGGEITSDGAQPVFVGRGLRVNLPPAGVKPGLAVLGFRPEAVSVVAAPGASEVELQVTSVEPAGADSLVTANTPAGCTVRARVPPGPSPGDQLRVYLTPTAVHLFEPGPDGRSLTPPAALRACR
jgi:multiple sugar transport system ATP-binding protein